MERKGNEKALRTGGIMNHNVWGLIQKGFEIKEKNSDSPAFFTLKL